MKKRSFLKNVRYILCILPSVLISCNPTVKSDLYQEGYAVFDWFQYEGKDEVFEVYKPGRDQYQNPILAGFYPDPNILKVGEDYYLVTSSFSFYPGIPIFHSKDLVNWTKVGFVLDRPSQLNLDGRQISHGIFAPALAYLDGIYYLITTDVNGIGNFYVTTENIEGPWSDPILLDFDGIDPSLFFDDDGRAYVVNNGPPDREPLYEGHRAIWIQELDYTSGELIGPRELVVDGGVDITKNPVWIEAPHIIKKKGHYYMIAAEGGTAEDHSQVVFRAKEPFGPYIPYKDNPILTQRNLDPERPFPVTSTGHASFVKTHNDEWWAVFLACRPYKNDFYNTGRETFMLPLDWEGDWPLILSGEETVVYVHQRPDLPLQQSPVLPTTGNFLVRDNFQDTSLALYWNFIRTPHDNWYELKNNAIWIMARPDAIHKRDQPSFIGRRQQHARGEASVSMTYLPAKEGDKAGLVAYQNELFYYFLGLTMEDNSTHIFLEKGNGSDPEMDPELIVSEPMKMPANATIYLKIETNEENYNFYYAVGRDNWILLMDNVDGTFLSTKVAGGFVGSYFGMYAYTP